MLPQKAKRYFLSCFNGPQGDFYNSYGDYYTETSCKYNPDRVIVIDFRIKFWIEDKLIREIYWTLFAEPIVIAILSWIVDTYRGKSITYLMETLCIDMCIEDLTLPREDSILLYTKLVVDTIRVTLTNYLKSLERRV